MPMKIWLPASLDLDNHLLKYPPINFQQFSRDEFAYILSLLIEIPAKSKEIREHYEGWVPLHSPILRNRVRNYSAYLQYALGKHYPDDEEAVLLITDNQYVKGEKSKHYRFANKYYTDSAELVSVEITEKRLVQNLNRKKAEKLKQAQKQYPPLANWFNPKLQIDSEAAIAHAKKLLADELEQIGVEELTGSLSENQANQKRIKAYHKHHVYLYNIESIKNGEFYLSIDSTARRLHTNLTSLKKDFRNFITYDDKQLVAIDIKNAQPYMSLALLRPGFYAPPSAAEQAQLQWDENIGYSLILRRPSRSLKLCNIAPELYSRMLQTIVKVKRPQGGTNKKSVKSFNINKVDSLIMYSNSLEVLENKDVKEYKQAVVNGIFYEAFAEAVSTNLNREWSRKDAKKAMFITFFSDNRFISSAEAEPKALFKELYPTIYDLFYNIKSKDKPALAVLLQSIESWLILDVVCKKIAREKPHVPLFTIHDSLITTTEHEAYVRTVMERAMERHIGFKPSLDVSYFSTENMLGKEVNSFEGEILLNEALGILSSKHVS